MPKFKVRLESPDEFIRDGVPQFRLTSLVAETPEAAQALCENLEYKKAAYTLPDPVLAEFEQAEAEAADQGVKVDAQVRMRLATHRQARPYAVVSVKEIG